jgi:tripartite-type tricarboxylate transporter receptor subunit TctC
MRRIANYPRRTITFMVGFAPGGGIDTFARVVAHELSEQLNVSVVIKNRPGAGSNIASCMLVGAVPDGYTLLFAGNSYAINQTLYRNPGYATEDLVLQTHPRTVAADYSRPAGSSNRTIRPGACPLRVA